jgi:putative acetyltransferase
MEAAMGDTNAENIEERFDAGEDVLDDFDISRAYRPNHYPMHIRPETPTDFAAIRTINIDAFAHHPFSHQTEHLIVEALRAKGALTLSLVAVVGEGDGFGPVGTVVGHIAFSPVTVGGREVGWHIAGPLAVTPPLQRKGIGSALVREGLARLRALGSKGCCLVGDPAYYTRLGFAHDPALTMHGVPPEVILCLPLDEGKRVPAGEVVCSDAFWVGM